MFRIENHYFVTSPGDRGPTTHTCTKGPGASGLALLGHVVY